MSGKKHIDLKKLFKAAFPMHESYLGDPRNYKKNLNDMYAVGLGSIFAAFQAIIGFIFSNVYIFADGLLFFFNLVLILFLYRTKINPNYLKTYFVLSFLIATFIGMYYSGGLYSPIISYLTWTPFAFAFLVNSNTAKVSVGITLGVWTVFYLLHSFGGMELEDKQVGLEIQYLLTINILALSLIMSLFVRRFITNSYHALRKTKDELEQKNQEINDSLAYAKRIQAAIFPDIHSLRHILPESFVYFNPKESVSGDLFWFAQLPYEGVVILSVIDCTGHGVPGGFMSVIADSGLNQLVHKDGLRSPKAILHGLHTYVNNAFSRTEDEKQSEGMDMGIIILDIKNQQLCFSGAMLDLWEFSENNELKVYKGDRQPIGRSSIYHLKRNYTEQLIPMQAGYGYFLFTDGLTDQFGGHREYKLKHKGLREWLYAINMNVEFRSSDKKLSLMMEAWQGESKQIDDQLLLGFRPLPKEQPSLKPRVKVASS